MSSATRVMVVEDHEVVRSGIESVLSKAKDLRVVGSFGSAEAALDQLAARSPDVVLLDHRLPGLSGAAAIQEFAGKDPSLGVIMLTTILDDGVLHACLVAGARGFLLKDVHGCDLVAAVRAVARGEVVLAPPVVQRVIQWARQSRIASDAGTLSAKEVVALSLIANGMTTREIARKLKVSEGTAKMCVRTTLKKLQASDRAEAVAAGMRCGII